MLYLLTVIGLTPGGSSTVHIYTQTIHRTTQSTQTVHRTTQSTQTIHRTTQSTQTVHRTTQLTNLEECGPCPDFESYTLAFALKLRKKHGNTLSQGSRRMRSVAEGSLSVVSVVCCQVEVSVSGRSFVQWSPNECDLSECNYTSSIMRRPWPTGSCCAMVKKKRFAEEDAQMYQTARRQIPEGGNIFLRQIRVRFSASSHTYSSTQIDSRSTKFNNRYADLRPT